MRPFRRYLTIIGVVTAVAIALRLALGVPSWITLAVMLIGWPFIGTLVTIDDDLPGGWSNPDGKYIAEWKRLWWWADLILVRGALVVLAWVVEGAFSGRIEVGAFAVAAIMSALGVPVFLRGVRQEIAHAG